MTRFREPFPILYAADVGRSARFYVENFSFAEAYRWPTEGEPDFVVLRLGSAELGIAHVSAPQELYGGRPQPGSAPRFELCIYTDDTDAAAEALRARGVRQLKPPETMPWGERLAYFEDPDGNAIQITAKIE